MQASETQAEEMLRLLREIHAALCGGNVKPAKEKKPSVSPRYGQSLVDHMEPGEHYIAENFIEYLASIGIVRGQAEINTVLTTLAQKGKIERVRRGIYRLPVPQQTEEK